MTQQIARYATLRFQPYPNRSEHLNYGIVVFMPQGGVRVHLARSLRKLKALTPISSLEGFRQQETEIPKLVGDATLEDALGRLNALYFLRNTQPNELGAFFFANDHDYEQNVELALKAQCDVTASTRAQREPRSRLYVDVRSRFKAIGILSPDRGILPDHQVVEHYMPDPDVDVKVEFALQNGILRVAQTVDLRTGSTDFVTAANRNVAFSKAYAIHVTKASLHNVDSYGIAAGADSESARKVLAPIAKDVTHIIHWEDGREMEDFFSTWADAAGKPLPRVQTH